MVCVREEDKSGKRGPCGESTLTDPNLTLWFRIIIGLTWRLWPPIKSHHNYVVCQTARRVFYHGPQGHISFLTHPRCSADAMMINYTALELGRVWKTRQFDSHRASLSAMRFGCICMQGVCLWNESDFVKNILDLCKGLRERHKYTHNVEEAIKLACNLKVHIKQTTFKPSVNENVQTGQPCFQCFSLIYICSLQKTAATCGSQAVPSCYHPALLQ